jgi:hypothetical protein
VEWWAAGKSHGDWLFGAPRGGPLPEPNWKRSVRWTTPTKAIGVPTLRVHELRLYLTCVRGQLGKEPASSTVLCRVMVDSRVPSAMLRRCTLAAEVHALRATIDDRQIYDV